MDRITQLQNEIEQLLNIMSASITYLCAKTNFEQVSEAIPITKQRNAEKYDPPDVFDANKKELVADLVTKAKQVETLIRSLPAPEAEETQVRCVLSRGKSTNDQRHVTVLPRYYALNNLNQRCNKRMRNILQP